MKTATAEEILSKHTGETGIYLTHGMVRGSDALEAMEEYRLQSHPSPMSADGWQIIALDEDGTQHQVKHENGSAFTGNYQQCLSFYELVSGKSPMSAEQVEELGYYYPLFKFFSDEHGLSLLDSQLQDVIHECKKFIEPSTTGESWKAEYDNCRALLQELVSLKVMRENLYKGNPDGKEYAERKPKAWQAAQQFLLTYQHEGFATTPSVKADGWVSVQEKQRLEQIIELKEKERKEWADMCIAKQRRIEELENPLGVIPPKQQL